MDSAAAVAHMVVAMVIVADMDTADGEEAGDIDPLVLDHLGGGADTG